MCIRDRDHIYARLAAHEGLGLKKLVLYTTRPIRAEEENGKQYYFVDDKKLEEFRSSGNLIEARAYHTVHGIWNYFTADDGQVELKNSDYLGIGTLESYVKMREYYGKENVCPVYIEVEDGERLARALKRERGQELSLIHILQKEMWLLVLDRSVPWTRKNFRRSKFA